MGRFSVPFFNMMNFSTTCGMGLKGASSIRIAATINIEYGMVSRKFHIFFPFQRSSIERGGPDPKSPV